MKKYRATLCIFDEWVTNPEVMDLINIEDEMDIIMCAPDEFFEGELVTEGEFYLKNAPYVDDQGVHNGTFAFKN